MSNIGVLNEKPLHATLKEWIARPGDRFEVNVDGYIVDIVRDELLIEIQTKNFSSIKKKLLTLLKSHPVRLIYPIALEKWILKPAGDKNGGFSRRKSPKRGCVEEVFREIVYSPQLLINPDFSLEVVMIREAEVRYFDEKRNWRRKGWGTVERRLLEVVESRVFLEPTDWRALIPDDLDAFTTRDLADAKNITNNLAQKMAYSLRKVNIITLIGKRGRANLYKSVSTH